MSEPLAAHKIIHVALFTRNPRELAPFYRDAFGMKIVHVGGAVQFGTINITGQLLQLHESGKVRILAVTSADRLKGANPSPHYTNPDF